MPTYPAEVERYRALVARYFPADQIDNALAVLMLESGGGPMAHNTNGEDSRGLFQINVGPGAHPSLASLNLFDPATNIEQAASLWQSSGWGIWSTWQNAQAWLAKQGATVTGAAGSAADAAYQSGQEATGQPGAVDLLGAIQGIGTTIAKPFNTLFATLTQWSNWLADPNLGKRFLLGLLGTALVIGGVVYFGWSLIPQSGQRSLASAAGAAL